MPRFGFPHTALLFLLSGFLLAPPDSLAQSPSLQIGGPPEISGGAEASRLAPRITGYRPSDTIAPEIRFGASALIPWIAFDAYDFDDNATETGGFLFVPPDPIGAAGTDRLISVVNVGIECRSKTGTLLWRDALKDFFGPLGSSLLGTFTFDPKVVYDEHENRFVVMTMELVDNGVPANNASRIHVAVSKTSSPASATSADWWYLSIDSKITVGASQLWADYPGLEVDEEVVYITSNFFSFSTSPPAYDQRLYIIQKGVVGGFYGGGAGVWNQYDPYTATGIGGFKSTTMPCQVHGAGGVATGVGTYLLSYAGLTYGGMAQPEALIVIRVDNPTGVASFTQEFVTVGDIEDIGGALGWPALPDAPQSGTAVPIEVNDRRALDAVWRNGYIYLTTTIIPNASDPVNQGTTTAHVFKLDATAVTSSASPAGLIGLAGETNIGAEDVATGTYTFFPAVAVNGINEVKVGFSGSASSIYGSAFAVEINQATFTPLSTVTVRSGIDYYIRTFGGGRNRWGDFSGISVDPTDNSFWVFNQWADTRGTPTNPGAEDGRWGTAWLQCIQQVSEDFGDAPDAPYPTLLVNNGARHTIVQGVNLGVLIDAEPDGLPSPAADGDDLNSQPDEDGVAWITPLLPGQPAQAQVTATVAGYVDIYIDTDFNGSWFDPLDLVFSGAVAAGPNLVNLAIPPAIPSGPTYARVRYSLGGPLPPDGPAQNGEVEDYEVFIEEEELNDFGDAPDGPYPTLLGSNGAEHAIVPGIFMGNLIDGEPDGQPTVAADGDDLNNQPDEDGLTVVMPLVVGQQAQFDIVCSTTGWLDVYVDIDGNGSWFDAVDLVASQPAVPGNNPVPFLVPANAVSGPTYVRIRFNTSGSLPPDGFAPDGEVEDYEAFIESPEEDFGDAPDSYRTLLASNGPHHVINPNAFMGALIDAEPDGTPTPSADGDDLSNLPDEDGVAFVTPLQVGQPAQVDVTVSMSGWLDAWIDFDLNGVFDPTDLIYSGGVSAGLNPIGFVVPAFAKAGPTYARFRYNISGAPLPPDGAAPDGEVEDYLVDVLPPEELDYGDAPDGPYPTLIASNGARHVIQAGVSMGAIVDAEPDGQPHPNALGDDLANLADEDGVTFTTPLYAGLAASLDVTVTVNGQLDAWIDFDGNGIWSGAEQIYAGVVPAGLTSIPYFVPAGSKIGPTFARFRYNIAGVALPPDGPGPEGEVEDYEIDIDEPPLDFGDAPDPTYPTRLASNGANHVIVPGVFLGNLIDAEPDGLPDPSATGDDINNLPDEDGVILVTPFVPGQPAQVDVFPSVPGWVDLWFDYDGSGSWDASELAWSGAVVGGLHSLFFNVPGLATPGNTFVRVRYNLNGPLPPDGPASDGEVEDYRALIEEPPLDFGDAPDPSYPTLHASNGARHVIVPGVFLGTAIDLEGDGFPDLLALGDDNDNLDDEDGVVWSGAIFVGDTTQVQVTASAAGWVDLWIDLDTDGTWSAGELMYSGNVGAGVNVLPVIIPTTARADRTYARVRYNLTGALPVDGLAGDGEVEDYEVFLLAKNPTGIPGDGTPRAGFAPARPNPMTSGQVTVAFTLADTRSVTARVYSMDGREVAVIENRTFAAGSHELVWDGRDAHGRRVNSGLYFLRLEAGDLSRTQKVMVLR